MRFLQFDGLLRDCGGGGVVWNDLIDFVNKIKKYF